MMLTAAELEAAALALDQPLKELQMRIMEDAVRRIRINGEITASADWQIHRMHELGMSKREIKKYIKEALDLSNMEMNHLYRDVLRRGYARDEALYKFKGKPFIPFEENAGLQRLISAISEQTSGTLQNITQSMGFAVKRSDGSLQFLPIADYYQKTLDRAMLDISSGAFDYNTVLRRCVSEMVQSGIRTVDYASGTSTNIVTASRRAVMTGFSQLTAKMNEDNAKALDTDMFEVTWHGGARPSHQVWQGRWYTHEQLVSVCGLGSVTGLCGANCYHDYYPVIPGISEPIYTPEELDRMNAEENIPKPYEPTGKSYTKYEALQRQRRLESTMRKQRQSIRLLEEGGADENDILAARSRYRGTSQEYTAFSAAMGLPQQRERVTMDGLGRSNRAASDHTDAADNGFFGRIKNLFSGKPAHETVPQQFSEALANMKNKTVSSIFQRAYAKAEFLESPKKNSYFYGKDGKIYIAPSATPSTVAHEIFHQIDHENEIVKSGLLNKCVRSDFENLKKMAETSGQSIEDMLYLKYPEAFVKKGKMKESFRGVSDIINGMTNDTVRLGYRHDAEYWSKPLKLQKETFAQYGRFYFEEDPDVLRVVGELFPRHNKTDGCNFESCESGREVIGCFTGK